ncbi:MAG: GNAT family N-acetyltransferase [Alphaproteobacteria bacterium]|nr:GNAT family N-acetyltransferase [Alphaproteobacteria bacterium]
MAVITVESPLQDEIRDMVAALNQTLLSLTPREFCHHLTVEQMADGDTTLFVAREDGKAVAMGALKRHGGSIGEVKRMYTLPTHQGRGLGGQILHRIEAQARNEQIVRLVLETGNNFAAAARVYRREGFNECGPVLDYAPSPWTAFYEKHLRAEPVQMRAPA